MREGQTDTEERTVTRRCGGFAYRYGSFAFRFPEAEQQTRHLNAE
jgi:hypothetical protein